MNDLSVTVLMPVYNTPMEFLRLAVDSILTQTYEKFQFLIIDDNNPDGELRDYLYSNFDGLCCVDVVRKKENNGLASTLDYGLEYATGDLIVRMDSDDIAYPNLVAKQVEFFRNNPTAHICGVQIMLFSDAREWYSNHPKIVTKYHAYNSNGYWFLNHPGVAYLKKTVLEIGGYGDTPAHFAEDYALWIKFLKAGYVIYNQPEVLLEYRVVWTPKNHQNRRSQRWLKFLSDQKHSLKDE